MSILLEQAIEKARELPEPDQDIAAAEILGVLSDFPTPEERAAIAESPGRQVMHDVDRAARRAAAE